MECAAVAVAVWEGQYSERGGGVKDSEGGCTCGRFCGHPKRTSGRQLLTPTEVPGMINPVVIKPLFNISRRGRVQYCRRTDLRMYWKITVTGYPTTRNNTRYLLPNYARLKDMTWLTDCGAHLRPLTTIRESLSRVQNKFYIVLPTPENPKDLK